MGGNEGGRRGVVALMLAFVMAAAMVAKVAPIGLYDAAGALPPATATIGGGIWEGANDGTGPVLIPGVPGQTDALLGATVMVQNQHHGGAVIAYPTVIGNTWSAVVPAPGDYVVMFSTPGHDMTSREFTVGGGDVVSKDAFLAAMPLPTASLLYYAFYDNYVNGEDDAPADPPMNGVTVTVEDRFGNLLATGVTGTQPDGMVLDDGTVLANTDGYFYFTGLPAGKVEVGADPATAYGYTQPTDPVTGSELGTSWDSTTSFYLMTSEEGGHKWDPALYPGDPGTEAGAYLIWHGFVEDLGQIGSAGNPTLFNPTLTGTVEGTMIDADSAGLDPAEPWPIPGEDHPGVTLNTVVPDGFVVLFTNAETSPVHPVATVAADPVTGKFKFENVPFGSYKLFMSDIPIDYVWNQAQVRVGPGLSRHAVVNPLVPRFFARTQGYVYDDSTVPPTPIAGAKVNLRYKSGSVKDSRITDASGFYNFDDLPEIEVLGHVDVELPPGFHGAMRTETFYPGGKDPGHPSYALYPPFAKTFNAMNRYVQWYTANYRADFHVEPIPAATGDISGMVWDENLDPGTWLPDGVYDPTTERALHGVTVELWDSTGTTLIASTTSGNVDTTDLEAEGWIPPYTAHLDEAGGVFVGPMPGFYEFRDLAPGDYQVRVTLPPGFFASPSGSDTVNVTVAGGARTNLDFGGNTLVPQAGEIEGGVFDDVNIDYNPASLLHWEKAGVPGAPVGVYDHLGYLLGSGTMGNPLCFVGATACPPGEQPVQKPEMERRFAPGPRVYLGNDPSLPGYNPDYLPMALAYYFEQGQYRFEADWSLLPTAALGIGGAVGPAGPLVPLNAPVINSATTTGTVTAGTNLTINGTDFGATRDGATVTLSGKKLEPVTWSDTQVVVSVPLDAVSGPALVATTAGISNGLAITVNPAPALAPLAALAASPPSSAVYVDSSNTGPADGSQASPWPTIGDALLQLTVLPPCAPRTGFVGAGTYNEQVHITESDVHIIGDGPHETVFNATMTDTVLTQGVPNGGGPVFYIGQGPITGPVHNVEISGFTITGGSVADEIGAGIFAGLHNSAIDINNNMIVRNGGYYGGGIWFNKSVHDVKIWSNTIAENGNMGGYGGGISINDEPEDPNTPEHSQPEHTVDDALNATPPGTYEINNNLIFHNLSSDYGGGIALYELKDRIDVHDNMIIENKAWDHGGGLFTEDAGPTRIYRNVFLRNWSPDDGGAMSFEDHSDGTTATGALPKPTGASHRLEVSDNLIAQNIADGHGENNARGGAIALDDTFDADIHHNTIVGNIVASSEAPAGGAIDSERNGHEYNGQMGPEISPGYSDPLIHNNIIWDNWKLTYDQPGYGGEEDLDLTQGLNFHWTPDQLHVDNPVVQPEWKSDSNSLSFRHVDDNVISCGYPLGGGNTDADPRFVDSAGLDWTLAGDSPVVRAGVGMAITGVIPDGIIGAVEMPVRDPGLSDPCPLTPVGLPPTLASATPTSPGGVAAVAGDHVALVSWQPPRSVGDTVITHYEVTTVPASDGCTTPDAATYSCDVGGLHNFTHYAFIVSAVNLAGGGAGGVATATPTGQVCQVNPTPFTDVSGSFAEPEIGCVYGLGLTTGVAPDSYAPDDNVTREQIAAFLGRLWRSLGGSTSVGTASPFIDIEGSFAATDIGLIYDLGITTGVTDTRFAPRQEVTREQVAAFLGRTWRALGGTCTSGSSPFVDTDGSFAKSDIACLRALNITHGTSAITFTPNGTVSREEAAAFLARFWQAAVNWGL